MKHILINGGLGFVGFHTAKALELNPNYKTIIFDASKDYINMELSPILINAESNF